MRCKICKQEIRGRPIFYPQGLGGIYICENCFHYLQNAKPSEVVDVYWIYAVRKKGMYPKQTSRSGKWLVFVDHESVDELWVKIRKAVEDGKLGNSAKVSTAKPRPTGTSKKHVICVYTYDWTDEVDVKRIREELRKLGVRNKIPYKSDEDTLRGRYRVTGHTRISKYYE